MKNHYEDLDQLFFSYPFIPQIHHLKNAKNAFSSSKLSNLVNSGLMYSFVTGISDKEAVSMTFAEVGNPNGTGDNDETKNISVQAVRIIRAEWRKILFRREEYRTHIFETILKKSLYAQINRDNFVEEFSEFDQYSLTYSSVHSEEHLVYWEGLQHCIYDCPTALNLKDHKKKFNSLTISDLDIILWRTFLSEKGKFDEWKRNRIPLLQKNINQIGTETKKRNTCARCTNQSIRKCHNYIIQFIMKFLAPYRKSSPDIFHDKFFSALIYAYCQAEIWIVIGDLKSKYERFSTLEKNEQALWKAVVYELDHKYQRLVNAIMNAMVDCLADAKISS